MPTNEYNGLEADLEIIPAGTELYRINPTHAPWKANSYNPKPPRALGDRRQGRFEPLDASLGTTSTSRKAWKVRSLKACCEERRSRRVSFGDTGWWGGPGICQAGSSENRW